MNILYSQLKRGDCIFVACNDKKNELWLVKNVKHLNDTITIDYFITSNFEPPDNYTSTKNYSDNFAFYNAIYLEIAES